MAFYGGRLLSNALWSHANRPIPQSGPPLLVEASREFGAHGPRRKTVRWRDVRRRRFAENPNCHWCGEPMLLIERWPGQRPKIRSHPDEATIDHLDERWSGRRKQWNHGEGRRTVLAHLRCNGERDRKAMIAMPIQNRWEMSRWIFLDICKRSGALNEVEL